MKALFGRNNTEVNLKDLYKNCSVFFIGSGPSLLQQDLTFLNQRGIVTFAVNNIAAKTIRPNLWCSVDEPKSFHEAIWLDPAIMKFVNAEKAHKHFFLTGQNGNEQHNSNLAARDCPNTFTFNLTAKFNHETFLDENNVCWGCERGISDSLGVKSGRSVMMAALKIITHLGFKRIYLLGCDFHMEHDEEGKGKGKTYAFSQYKHKGGCGTNNKNYDILQKRLTALKPLMEERDIHIFNCTPNSR